MTEESSQHPVTNSRSDRVRWGDIVLALVFASGETKIAHMCKAGIWLNIVGITLVMLHMYLVVMPMLGM